MNSGRTRRSPGWYQDPDDPTRVRHWNGRGWTGRRRPRPTWHVLPNDLAPDPHWGSPGGINGTTQRELLGDADRPASGRDQRGAGSLGDRPLDLDDPHYENPASGLRGGQGPYLEDPMGGDSLDKPLHAEGSAPEWGYRSEHYRADRFRTGSRSSWAAPAAFGLEPRWPLRPAGSGSHAGGSGRFSYGSSVKPAGALPPLRWGRSRTPLVIVVSLTLFAVVALLINLGTTARGRFSAVSVDATFIGQANAACAATLGSGRLGSKTVMTSGTSSRDGARPGTRPSVTPSAGPGSPSANASRSAAGVKGAAPSSEQAAPSSEQLATLTKLVTRLGRIRATPAAAPQVAAWLDDWHRYLTDERDFQKAGAAHNGAAASQDLDKAHTAAAGADLFAADNGMSACAIDDTKSGLETIP